MNRSVLMMLALVPLVFAGRMLTAEAPVPDPDHPHAVLAAPQYVGSDKCRMCHRKPEQGEQFGAWEKSDHAKAYATLATAEAKEVGKKVGVSDPQNDPKCLKCHTTGHGEPASAFDAKFDVAEGVGCEACHGPGSEYGKKKPMEAAMRGEIDEASIGLVVAPDEQQCKTCHNEESPTYKPFNYKEKVKEIAHPIPEARKAEYK